MPPFFIVSVVLSSVSLSLGLCGLHTFFAPSFFCPLFLSSLSTLPVLLLCPTACQRCPAGTEPVLGYEYKWWNVLPANMKTSCFNVGNNNCDGMNGERGLQWRALGARGRCWATDATHEGWAVEQRRGWNTAGVTWTHVSYSTVRMHS